MEKKKTALAFMLVLFILSVYLEVPHVSAQIGCVDSCQTGCINRDIRLQQRCERKCEIRCGPDVRAGNSGGN